MSKSIHIPASALSWPIFPAWSRLDATCVGVFDCPHTTPVLVEEGPYVVRSQDIRGRVFDWRNAGKVTEATYKDRIARAEPQYGDLLYSREGTYFGIAAEVPMDMEVCLGQRMVLIRPDPNKLDHRFLLYWLNSPVMDAHLGGFRDGSVAERLNMTTIRALPVPLLPLPEQREISAILGTLDDKIEVNRKASATLEEMARALYRSWFVDFDPVWARLEGRQPAHMDPATAALFPDSFDDVGVPVGWSERGLDEIADFLNGAALQKYPAADGEDYLTVIKIAELRNGISAGSGRASAGLPEKFKIVDGDVIFSWSGSLLQKVWTGGEGALNQHLFKVTSSVVPKWFHYYAVDHHMDDFRMIAASKATTMGHIQRHHLSEAKVMQPDDGVLHTVDRLVAPLFDRMIQMDTESRTLAALRDALLPRLMSGELRVGEGRELVEEVA